MKGLFIALFLFSIVTLTAGLVKPKLIFKWNSEKLAKFGYHKAVSLVFGLLILLFFILSVVTSKSQKSTEQIKSVKQIQGQSEEQLTIEESGQLNKTKEPVVKERQKPATGKSLTQTLSGPSVEQNQIKSLQEENYKVTYVIDGDTIELEGGERVRLLGINSPEREQPYYSEARKKLTELVLNKTVRLEKDITDKDRYGRLLRYVYVGNLFVNLEMVRLGYANSYTYPPDVKYQNQLLAAEQEARNATLGLWSPQPEPQPEPPKPTSPPLVQSSPNVICSYNAYDCTDFTTHKEAQNVFEQCGGINNDVHKLDKDKDGIVCESLP